MATNKRGNYLYINKKHEQMIIGLLKDLKSGTARKIVRSVYTPKMAKLKREITSQTPSSSLTKKYKRTYKGKGKAQALVMKPISGKKYNVNLKQNIVRKEKSRPSKGRFMHFIAVKKPVYWMHFLRHGTKNRKVKSENSHPIYGTNRGKMKENDYVQKLADKHFKDTKGEVLHEIEETLKKYAQN